MAASTPRVVLELWLEAADDPTLALPASLLRDGSDEVFAFLRESDPRRALEPASAADRSRSSPRVGIELRGGSSERRRARRGTGGSVPARGDAATRAARRPRAAPARVGRDDEPRHGQPRRDDADRLVERPPDDRDAIASFDWRLAIGDVELTEDELAELAAAKEPLVRLRGRWHTLRTSEVERALRFLEAPRDRSASSSSSRAVSRARDRRGRHRARRGPARRDARRAARAARASGSSGRSPTPAGHAARPLPVPGARPRLAAAAGRPRVGGILADDMGLGKTVQAIAMLVSERQEDVGDVGPTLVVCPMSVSQQWEREIARFAPGLRVHAPSRPGEAPRRRLPRGRGGQRRRRHLVRRRDTRRRPPRARSRGIGCSSTRRRT